MKKTSFFLICMGIIALITIPTVPMFQTQTLDIHDTPLFDIRIASISGKTINCQTSYVGKNNTLHIDAEGELLLNAQKAAVRDMTVYDTCYC